MWLPGPFFVMAVDFLRLAAGKRVYMHASPSAAGKLQVFRQQRKNPEYMHETPLPAVGMSQCGAVGYAQEQGMNYKKILQHYYPGAGISTSGSGGGFFSWLHSLFHW